VSRPGPTGSAKGRLRAPFLFLGLLVGLPSAAQDRPRSWPEERCARYSAAWGEALARFGRAGLGAEFLDRHDAFLARGCTPPREVCPRSRQELALADVMSAAAVNAGATGSFLPFACRE
jgi:hypothetical protein